MKLFWLCRIGSFDSFSRVSKNVLPELKKHGVELYTSVNPNGLGDFKDYEHLFKEYIMMGSPIQLDKHSDSQSTLSFQDFKLANTNINDLGQMMRFTLLQSIYYCYHNKIDRLMITNGNNELNWFMKMISHVKNKTPYLLKYTKIVVYSPFDYIPSNNAILYYNQADIVITTIPPGSESIKDYKVVGHANDKSFKRYPDSHRSVAIDILNKGLLGDSSLNTHIEYDDVIILNANLYGARKRIETTVEAFSELIKRSEGKCVKYKLWLHNGGKLPENINKIPKENLIITGPCSSDYLNLIYNVCKIGLQTSWGEGWSLTNCEHAVCGGIQVVPDFLATGYHFKENRGVLIKVTEVIQLNEESNEVTVGIVSINDTVIALEKAVLMSKKETEEIYSNFVKYFDYTWESETIKLIKYLNQNNFI